MESRKILLYLHLKHNGDWQKIYECVSDRESMRKLDEEEIDRVCDSFKGNYITAIDKEYPKVLLQSCYKPPFVLFYEGDLKVLTNSNKKIAIGSKKVVSETEIKIAEKIIVDKENATYIISGDSDMDKYLVETISHPMICVFPNSLDKCELKQKILDKGGVVISEGVNSFMSSQKIMVGLSDKILMLNSERKNERLVLAITGVERNKDVLVVPVSPLDTNDGNNDLISSGAYCVWNSQGLEYEIDVN